MGATGVRLTYQDLLALPEDGKRHEILEGEEYVSPAPNIEHQDIIGELYVVLRTFARRYRLGRVFLAPTDVILSPDDIVEPDLLFVAAARAAIVKIRAIEGAPDLAIEVISETSRHADEVVKRRRYEKFGVGEYWIVDPEKRAAKINRRASAGASYGTALKNGAGGALASPLFPGLKIPLAPLFADPRPR